MKRTPDPPDRVLAALEARGSSVRRVRYRSNRRVLLSVSGDGRTLNSHVCFRDAPGPVAEAVAVWVTSRPGSRERSRALEVLRDWEGTRQGLEEARRRKPGRRSRTNGRDTAPLRALFERLNENHFEGALPEIPLRVSRRMTRTLGTIRYGPDPGSGKDPDRDGRTVVEIAISAGLLLPRRRESLKDTMLHEMAHAEAWLLHGHRGHGRPWRRIAERVGCVPRARRTAVLDEDRR